MLLVPCLLPTVLLVPIQTGIFFIYYACKWGSELYFKWPKKQYNLLSLKEDILTEISAQTTVEISTRVSFVRLSAADAAKTEFVFDEVVYLKPIFSELFLFINYCFWYCSSNLLRFYLKKNLKSEGGIKVRSFGTGT